MNFNYSILLFLISSFLFLESCQPTSSNTSEKEKTTRADKKATQKKKAVSLPTLTTQNAPEILKAYGAENTENIVLLKTRLGNIKIRLYEQTPYHRANFLMLSKRGYFSKTQFYRVIKDFMIQGGGTDDLSVKPLQRKIGRYLLPPEIDRKFFHKRGAVSMSREYENNPEKKSACYDFFIVTGRKYSDPELNSIEKEYKITLPPAQRDTYKSEGGAAHLDGDHTVFGEVIEGMEVVEQISYLEVNPDDNWPKEVVTITTEVQ